MFGSPRGQDYLKISRKIQKPANVSHTTVYIESSRILRGLIDTVISVLELCINLDQCWRDDKVI